MENIRFSARSIVGRERLGLIVFALITLLAGDVSSKLLAAPQGTLRSEDAERPQEGQTPAFGNAAPALDWESQARLHRGLEGSSGTLTLSQDGVAFRPTKGSLLNLPFLEIQTFDLLTPQRLVITGYENRSWHRHGEKKYRFDLSVAMPPDVAAELARRVAKPVRNGNPNPDCNYLCDDSRSPPNTLGRDQRNFALRPGRDRLPHNKWQKRARLAPVGHSNVG